jgi:2-oxoglutarate ferredoxin oxidoreductase subunit alpha
MIGQMMEPVEFPDVEVGPPMKADDWALTGCKGRKPRQISSLYLDPVELDAHNRKLQNRYRLIKEKESRWELYNCDEPYDLLITSFGMTSRICKTAIDEVKKEGINVGMFRPVTVKPFPDKACRDAALRAKAVLDVEMNMGQMLTDVQLCVKGDVPIEFFGKCGGLAPSVGDVTEQIYMICKKTAARKEN